MKRSEGGGAPGEPIRLSVVRMRQTELFIVNYCIGPVQRAFKGRLCESESSAYGPTACAAVNVRVRPAHSCLSERFISVCAFEFTQFLGCTEKLTCWQRCAALQRCAGAALQHCAGAASHSSLLITRCCEASDEALDFCKPSARTCCSTSAGQSGFFSKGRPDWSRD